MLDGLFQLIANLLNFFYTLIPNYAVAIALLTCVVMLITTPLTLKGTRSMIEMQRLGPELRRLQQQYKDDPQKRQEEMMRFYKEHDINPVGGCLPLIVQMPVFSVLYFMVRGLTNESKFVGLQRALADHGLNPTITDGFRPKYLSHSTELYQALLGQHEMDSFGVDLARSANSALQDGFLTALPYLLLVAVIALLSWFQQRQITGRNPGGELTQQQRMMMVIGPVMYVLIAFNSPAAIGVYFLVSTAWRVAQQAYITQRHYRGEDSIGAQALRASAKLREERGKDGGGTGAGGRAARGTGKETRDGSEQGVAKRTVRKAAGGASENGSGARQTKPGARSGARAGSTRAKAGGTSKAADNPAGRPHPRSRKKKKRK